MVKCSSFGTAGGSHFYFFFRQNSWWKPRRGFVGLDVSGGEVITCRGNYLFVLVGIANDGIGEEPSFSFVGNTNKV